MVETLERRPLAVRPAVREDSSPERRDATQVSRTLIAMKLGPAPSLNSAVTVPSIETSSTTSSVGSEQTPNDQP